MNTTAGVEQTPLVDAKAMLTKDRNDYGEDWSDAVVDADFARTLELRVQSLEAQVKGLKAENERFDRIIDDCGVAISCINPVEDLRRAIQHLKDKLAAAEADKAAIREACDKYVSDAEKLDAIDSGLVVISGGCLRGWRVRKSSDNGFINSSWHVSPSLRHAIDHALDLAQRTAGKVET